MGLGLFEYYEGIQGTNLPFTIAFITVHANYGTQGVQVVTINRGNTPEPTYEMETLDDEGAFHHLTFNKEGDKFALLLYQTDRTGKKYRDYFSIREYSLEDDEKPIKNFTTDFNFWQHDPIYTRYLSDSLLCIIRRTDIIIFDMDRGETKELLERDLDSAFYAGFNILIYQSHKRLVVDNY